MEKTAALILAAGEGKRMKSAKAKVLHEVLFKPMLDWVSDSVLESGIEEICIVTGHLSEQVEEHIGGRFSTVRQTERLGTAHAVLQAKNFLLANGIRDVVILCADAPFVGSDVLKESYALHKSSQNAVTVITAETEDPYGYGRILRDGEGNVCRIAEEKDATSEEKSIREINSGAYWFEVSALLDAIARIKNKNAKGEYYLTDAVALLAEAGRKCGAVRSDMSVTAAANDRRQLMELNAKARRAALDRLYEEGVSIVDESGIIVGPDVKIGRDTTLLPGTILRGKCVIGQGCVIGPNSLIDSCEFGDEVVFNASQAYRSKIGSRATIGPFVHIRPNSVLHEKVHVGDFVEIKNSEIGEGTKVPHLTYVGDSDVGGGVNFGCGCVTVNYDGVSKSRTKVGDGAFIGCNTNLVAPVEVGKNAYTAAGSTITRDVPENALAVARSRQQNLEGWVTKKRPAKKN
ncbi:MAG TPA: bifunctional UDP-N-acetylglucosamine diphosphorylase/glucosamine-1-phosphate N-acetyltransferase GlmU [Clostridia bacterium]|nr:bifunctional UDP-N-acetylglucosamine diphosphorylase/glucosamine-1-phosphate N-acetyltransferase GlmU [Clostridia bacterium]